MEGIMYLHTAVEVEVGMVGSIHEVDRGATLQKEEPEGRTLAHQRGIVPILDLDPGLGPIPRKCLGPILDPSHHEGGLQLCQTMEILSEGGQYLGHLQGSAPSLLEFAMEALGVRGLLLLGRMTELTDEHNYVSGSCVFDCSFGSEPVYFALCA